MCISDGIHIFIVKAYGWEITEANQQCSGGTGVRSDIPVQQAPTSCASGIVPMQDMRNG